jgi:hypothetical protein
MNGRTRPGPEWGICPACGRKVGLRVDGTLADHTPTGDPYATACKGRRPDNTRLRASIRFGAGLGTVIATLLMAYTAPVDQPDRLTVTTQETGQ